MLKIWNVVLIILTFALTVFGTFITRSGIISSVHSFGQSSLGSLFLLFLGIVLFASFGLLLWRWDDLKSENALDSLLSRESSFLFNNLLFVGIAFAVLWGTLFPIVSEAVRGAKVTVGPPFYNQVTVPLGLILLLLTGICPLISWRKTTARKFRHHFSVPVSTGVVATIVAFALGIRSLYPLVSVLFSTFVVVTILLEFYRGTRARARIAGEDLAHALWGLVVRNKRRYGGYVVHLGMVMLFVGVTGSTAFKKEVATTLKPGESIDLGGYTLTYQSLSEYPTENHHVVAANVSVAKGGRLLGTLSPEKNFHKGFDPTTEVAIRSSLKEDLYVILAGYDEAQKATFKVLINPLVTWIWLGGLTVVLGTLIALGPDRPRQRVTRVPEPRLQEAVALQPQKVTAE